MSTNRSLRRAGFIVAALIAVLIPTELLAAGGGRGRCRLRPGHGSLKAGTPNINVNSYNGIAWRQQPTRTVNRGWVGRSRDPMAVVVRGQVQPDSTLTLHAQQKGKKLTAAQFAAVKGCQGLQRLADKAVVWKEHIQVKPVVASVNDQHTTIFKERDQVLMPNTPIKITGVTRDGRQYTTVHAQVQGLRDQNVQNYNHETQRVESQRIGGRFLKSAEAWIEPGNLLISQPVRDARMAGRGKSFLTIGRRFERSATKMQTRITALTTKINANQYQNGQDRAKDQQLLGKLQQALPRIQQKAQWFKQQGTKMRTEGKQLRAEIFSVGAVPNGAQVSITNPRLQGERAPRATNNGTADIVNGFLRTSIGGVHQDRIVTTVAFPGDASKKGSQVVVEARIPNSRDASAKPVMTVGSKKRPVKLYRLVPERIDATHQPADTQ